MKIKHSQRKQAVDKIGRGFSLLFNRAIMYKTNHPTTVQSASDFHRLIRAELKKVSPIAILCHRGALYVDEEAIDPKINVSKVVGCLKETGVESISFTEAVSLDDVNMLLDILTDSKRFPNASAMRNALKSQGIDSLSINHIVYRKVTEEETVVGIREAKASKVEPATLYKYLLDHLIELGGAPGSVGVLQDVFGLSGGLNTEGFASGVNRGLEKLDGELGEQLGSLGDEAIKKLLESLFHLKKELQSRLAVRQQAGKDGAVELGLLDKADSVTDGVILDLIRREYGKGMISVERLAHIIQRIIPDAEDMTRLLPRIERMLLKEGMHITDFIRLSEILQGNETGREVVSAIAEGAESIGLQGQELLDEITRDPRGAAELIYLASEIRRGHGDEGALTEVLVEYIERIGGKMALDTIEADGTEGEEHLQGVVARLEKDIVQSLRGRGISSEVMDTVVGKLSGRLEGCLKKLESDWELRTISTVGGFRPDATNVLSYFEETIDSMEDLKYVLQKARESVQELRESDEKANQAAQVAPKEPQQPETPILPKGVLGKKNTLYFVEKELQRAYRYKTPFSLALFEVIAAKVTASVEKGAVKTLDITTTVLGDLRDVVRDTDTVGILGNKRFAVLMPMTDGDDSRIALRRLLKELQLMEVRVMGAAVDATFAGAVTEYDVDDTPDIRGFLLTAENALEEMAQRLRNIQSYL